MPRRIQPGLLLAVAILACAPVLLLGLRYGFGNLLGHFSCDLYQPLADSFREGRSSLSVDAAKVAIFDATLWRGDIYLSFAPFPAALYAVLDAAAALFGLSSFPKVALFAAFAVAHTLALFFLLLRLAPRGVTLAALLTLSYILAFPLPNLIVYDVGASEVAALYTSTFVLLGALFWLRYQAQPSMWTAALAGLMLGAANLNRPTAWAYTAALLAVTFVLRRLRRDALCFGAIAGGAILAFLAYNVARFGNPMNFGDSFSYTGVWEQAVDNHGVAPSTFGRGIVRTLEALKGWFGVRPHTGADAWTLYVISEGGAQLTERANLLLLGLFAGAAAWIRAFRKPGLELALLAGVAAHFLFFVLAFQSVTSRYVLDVWPAIFLLSVAGLHLGATRASEVLGKPWLSHAFAIVALCSIAFTLSGRHGLAARAIFSPNWLKPLRTLSSAPTSNASLGDTGADLCPGGMIKAQHGAPPSSLSCSALSPREDESPPPSWVAQEDLHRLGLYRGASGRCYMLFFSGATLLQDAESSCRAELHLEPGAVSGCEAVELRLDGDTLGPMSRREGLDGKDRLVCSRALPDHGGGPVQLFFVFSDGVAKAQAVAESSGLKGGRWRPYFGTFGDPFAPRKNREAPTGGQGLLELRDAGGRYPFHELRLSCDAPAP
jgi:hypothetical protein